MARYRMAMMMQQAQQQGFDSPLPTETPTP
jgi:hypothetical protein